MMHHEVENAVAIPRYVWWDMDSCEIPDDCDPCEIRWIIESALIKRYGPGPLTIVAIGNLRCVPPHDLEAMSRSGIIITHTPLGVLSIVTHLFTWVCEHWKSPGYLMLISDLESCYYEPIVSFKSMGYTILRAYLNHPPPESPKYASYVWQWESLLTEETTRQELQGNCNETAWHCMLCCLDGQGFEDFTHHFEDRHSLKESLLLPHSCFIHEGDEHTDEESLLLPHKRFLETELLRHKHVVKDPVKKHVRIACLERRREKQLKALEESLLLPHSHFMETRFLPHKDEKQKVQILWARRRSEKKQLKAVMLPHPGGEDALKESHMVSPDLAAGPSEEDDFVHLEYDWLLTDSEDELLAELVEKLKKQEEKRLKKHLKAKLKAQKEEHGIHDSMVFDSQTLDAKTL